MSYLEKLLEGVEVEWKTLGEMCNIFTGGEAPSNSIKGDIPNDTYKFPIYGNGAKIYGYADTYRIDEDSVTISSIGANTGTIYFRKAFFTPIIRLKVVIPKNQGLLPRYLFHYLNSITISSKSSSVPNMNASDVKKIKIPIPPLEIQKEIVRILDTFTELSAELTAKLTAELSARKQQYSYYSDQLLSFEAGEVEWKCLEEVGEIKRGVAFTKKQAVMGKFPVVANAAEPISFHNESNRNGEFIVVARSGANAGLISYWNEELFLTDAFSIHLNDSILNTKFAFFYLKNHQRKIHLMKRGSGVPHVRASDFEIYQIPIPPIEEQERIVAILDNFDTLTNSIGERLPKEIELRKKQFEYYRDMLLTFPQLESV